MERVRLDKKQPSSGTGRVKLQRKEQEQQIPVKQTKQEREAELRGKRERYLDAAKWVSCYMAGLECIGTRRYENLEGILGEGRSLMELYKLPGTTDYIGVIYPNLDCQVHPREWHTGKHEWGPPPELPMNIRIQELFKTMRIHRPNPSRLLLVKQPNGSYVPTGSTPERVRLKRGVSRTELAKTATPTSNRVPLKRAPR